mmetsp:Transcript_13220/g.34896  ORF Transcript_13220/g.34896 Transcript_13220/m.34896 type:complete len:204 (-) Transcript_13220:405-1016(-)
MRSTTWSFRRSLGQRGTRQRSCDAIWKKLSMQRMRRRRTRTASARRTAGSCRSCRPSCGSWRRPRARSPSSRPTFRTSAGSSSGSSARSRSFRPRWRGRRPMTRRFTSCMRSRPSCCGRSCQRSRNSLRNSKTKYASSRPWWRSSARRLARARSAKNSRGSCCSFVRTSTCWRRRTAAFGRSPRSSRMTLSVSLASSGSAAAT